MKPKPATGYVLKGPDGTIYMRSFEWSEVTAAMSAAAVFGATTGCVVCGTLRLRAGWRVVKVRFMEVRR